MRLFVAGAIYLASGALFSTIDTVAGENPLCVATSLIVTAWLSSLGRFTRRAPRWPTSSRQTDSPCNRFAITVHSTVVGARLSTLRLPPPHSLLRRHLERQWLLEPACLPNPKCNSRNHPDASNDLRRAAKTQPQSQANNESKHRRDKIPRFLLFRMQEIAHKCRGIDAHKCDQRPEIQKLDSPPIGKEERTKQSQRGHEDHIVPRHLVLRVNRAKKRTRQRIASAHPVQQSRRPNVRSHP